MQHTRAIAPAVAATDDAGLVDRLHALEKRLATSELELQARGSTPPPEWRAWEERIARLENRLGAVEERAAVAARRPATVTPRAVAPAAAAAKPKPVPPPPSAPMPSASPQLSPAAGDEVVPEPVVPPKRDTRVPAATVTAPVARPRMEAKPEDPGLGEKLRRDWDAIKRQARRGGDEWREGWAQLKRVFSD
jgi:hypothetical protein